MKLNDVVNHVEHSLASGIKVTADDMTKFGSHIEPSRVIDVLRNKRFMPIMCQRAMDGMPTHWYMTNDAIFMYHNMRDDQKQTCKRAYKKKRMQRLLCLLSMVVDDFGKDLIIEHIEELD